MSEDIRICTWCKTPVASFEKYQNHIDENHLEILIKKCYFCEFESRQRLKVHNHIFARHSLKPILPSHFCEYCLEFRATSSDVINFHIEKCPAKLIMGHEKDDDDSNFRILKDKSSPLKIVLSKEQQQLADSGGGGIRPQHDEIVFNCHLCAYKTEDKVDFGSHLIQHFDNKCVICNNTFMTVGHLKSHVKEVHEGIKNHPCEICGQKFGRSGDLKCHVKTVHEGIKEHQCQFCEKKFGQLGHLKTHVKRVHVHDGVDQSQSLKRKKQVDNTQKRSKNVKNSKRMKMLEKEALDVSNIAGFDHENPIVGKVPTIKNEVKIEPLDENIDEGIKNVKVEPVEENLDKGSNNDETKNVEDVSKLKLKMRVMTEIGLFDVNEEEDYMILTKVSELIQKKKKN